MIRNIFLALGFLCCFVSAFGQQLKKADRLFKELAYVEASEAYEAYLKGNKTPSPEVLENIADSYYFISKDSSAVKYYKKLYELQKTGMSGAHFNRYVHALKGVEEYDEAAALMKEYLRVKGNEKEITRYAKEKAYLDSLGQATSLFTIRNLESNTNRSEFGTAFYGDKIVFSSTRKPSYTLYVWNQQPFLDLYIGDRNATDGELFNVELFLSGLESKYHDATITFSPDRSYVYYTTNILKNKNKLVKDNSGTNNFHIMKGTIEDGKVTKTESLPFNSIDYSVGHPSMSPDGKWMFFVSDMPGGFGNTDIYVVQMDENGNVASEPQNLGPVINTQEQEMFPYFREGKLYFSSDGHYGLGRLDVFSSEQKEGKMEFKAPKNLGAPVNSNKDDFSFIIDSTASFGYFSSNRLEGKGDDDIYYYTKEKEPCDQLVSGKVTNKNTQLALEGASVKVYDEFGDLVTEAATGDNGMYEVEIPCESTYKFVATKPNYTTEEKEVKTTKKDGDKIEDVDFELTNYDDLIVKEDDQEKIDVNPIYFDFDKADITPQAAEELNKVIYVMNQFPKVKIKIESHADCRGNADYNRKLTDLRAKSTQKYILETGKIDPSRIESAIGYGEDRPKVVCERCNQCSEEDHSENRRSDFIIIEK
ncbi:OmpA family protein [Sinomicrobium oceani]|uniref:OmpA family protein n=1 Tax=Sinomicrobium oceani TaxID=1150368 RepID=UPI00227CD133|nr:OmpA family protein [Sinomicrobium oceani]